MTRRGKIARLPHEVREELNRRLRDGKPGPGLLEWLNKHPKCKRVLAEEFESRPVTKQNLSEWKRGGYEDWLRKEESRQNVRALAEEADELETDAGDKKIADRLATVLEAELVSATRKLKDVDEPKERWERFKDISRELYRFRREDHHGRQLCMKEEKWSAQSKRDQEEDELRRRNAEFRRQFEIFQSYQNWYVQAAALGGGEYGLRWADWAIRLRHGLDMPPGWEEPKTANEWADLAVPALSPWGSRRWPDKSAEAERPVQSSKPKAKGRGSRVEGKTVASVEEPSSEKSGASMAEWERVAPSPSKSGQVQPKLAEGSGVEGREKNGGAGTVPEPAGGNACATQSDKASEPSGAQDELAGASEE